MNESKTSLKVKIWGGAWGLPSVDPVCLSVLAYASFTKAPITTVETVAHDSVAGTLPEMESCKMVYAEGLFSIIGIMRREGYNADYNLTQQEQADTLAFLAYANSALGPAIKHVLWMDNSNYLKATRPAYQKMYGFPQGLYYPKRMKNKMEDQVMNSIYIGERKSPADIEKVLHKHAIECIDVLEKQLGNSKGPFFFGSKPTTLDAAVYGYLGVLTHAPLASNGLKNHLISCENLKAHCAQVEKYLSKSNFVKKEVEQKKSESVVSTLKNRDTVITLGLGVTVMLAFAIYQGVFTSKRSILARKINNF